MLSFFPRDVLDEVSDLIESVSEGFSTNSFKRLRIMVQANTSLEQFACASPALRVSFSSTFKYYTLKLLEYCQILLRSTE